MKGLGSLEGTLDRACEQPGVGCSLVNAWKEGRTLSPPVLAVCSEATSFMGSSLSKERMRTAQNLA